MTTTAWGDASRILADAGVEETTSYYREFTSEDEKAVCTVGMRIQAAWKANDPDMFANMFADNGSLLMRDEQLMSREEIRKYMAAGFDGPLKGAHVKGWPIEVQFLGDDVAMMITEGGIIYAGQNDIAPENLIRSTWVIRRSPEGALNLVSHQSSPIKG